MKGKGVKGKEMEKEVVRYKIVRKEKWKNGNNWERNVKKGNEIEKNEGMEKNVGLKKG